MTDKKENQKKQDHEAEGGARNDLRKQLLEPRYQSLRLPDAGELEILPYLSLDAMEAAERAPQEGDILRMVTERSIKEGSAINMSALSEADLQVLAIHFLQDCGTEDVFHQKRSESSSVEEAFAVALKSSDDWKEHKRTSELIERHILREADFAKSVLSQYEQTAARMAESLESSSLASLAMDSEKLVNQYKIELPKFQLGLEPLIDRMTSQLAQMQLIQSPFKGLQDSIGASLTNFQAQLDASFAIIREDAFRLPDMSKLIEIPDLSPLSSDFLSQLNVSIEKSISQTLAVNRLFSAPNYWSPVRLREVAVKNDTPVEWIEDVEEIEEAAVVETLVNQQAVNEIVISSRNEIASDDRVRELPALWSRLAALADPKEFSNVLRRFASRIAREDWSIFWETPGERFRANPEALGKALLGNFLEGHGKGLMFIAHELHVGEGYVDVLAYFLGKPFIIELKMVGAGWGSGKAKGGIGQLSYYDERYDDADLFLIVFDGRKTQTGEKFPPSYKLGNGKTVQVLTVSIFSTAPTRKK